MAGADRAVAVVVTVAVEVDKVAVEVDKVAAEVDMTVAEVDKAAAEAAVTVTDEDQGGLFPPPFSKGGPRGISKNGNPIHKIENYQHVTLTMKRILTHLRCELNFS